MDSSGVVQDSYQCGYSHPTETSFPETYLASQEQLSDQKTFSLPFRLPKLLPNGKENIRVVRLLGHCCCGGCRGGGGGCHIEHFICLLHPLPCNGVNFQQRPQPSSDRQMLQLRRGWQLAAAKKRVLRHDCLRGGLRRGLCAGFHCRLHRGRCSRCHRRSRGLQLRSHPALGTTQLQRQKVHSKSETQQPAVDTTASS